MLQKVGFCALLFCLLFSLNAFGILIKKDCPHNEMFRSCMYHDEYTCWETGSFNHRVMKWPQPLDRCKSGCVCRRGFVRSHPEGLCMNADDCKDLVLADIIDNIPPNFEDFRR